MRFPNKITQEYYFVLKSIFPKMTYAEIRFLKEFKTSIIEYGLAHPNCTYEELTEDLGTPQDVLCEYFNMQDAGEMAEHLQKARMRKLMSLFIGVVIVIGVIVYWTLVYNIKTESSTHIPKKVVVSVVEEE